MRYFVIEYSQKHANVADSQVERDSCTHIRHAEDGREEGINDMKQRSGRAGRKKERKEGMGK